MTPELPTTHIERELNELKEYFNKNGLNKSFVTLLEDLSMDLNENEQISSLARYFVEYISHIKSLENRAMEYKDPRKEFGFSLVKSVRLLGLSNILKELIPLKKGIYNEIKKKNENGEKQKNIEEFILKFKNGRGIHELKKAQEYWNFEKFFQLPPAGREKILKNINEAFTPQNIKKQTKMLVLKTITLPITIVELIGAITLLISSLISSSDYRDRRLDK